ncbi:hypothetical protein VCRA2119O381_6440001 [Vibrio crassostreae]|nr:hypothetical protein VCRA2119O381_6440001 [Vibrio crassostreae]
MIIYKENIYQTCISTLLIGSATTVSFHLFETIEQRNSGSQH